MIDCYCFTDLPNGYLDLKDQEVNEGGTAQFNCSNDGPRNPHWSLNVDGMEYTNLFRDAVERVRRHKVVGTRTLVVSNVNMSDNGSTYQCTYPLPSQGYCTSIATLYVISNRKCYK